jgi:hypothetical protein
MSLIAKIRRALDAGQATEVLRCGPGDSSGIHGEVIYGLGCMGDASICLRCGYETYGRIYPRESIRHVKAPDDWPAIEEARQRSLLLK